jgi:hypothetical protein
MNGKGRTGRPLKTGPKRIKKIDVRFTQDEYEAILGLEKTLGLNRTDIIRARVLNEVALMVVNARELIALLDKTGTELGRCANNINQLAKYANILSKSHKLSPVVIERFNYLLEQYIQHQKMIDASLRKVIRMAGA